MSTLGKGREGKRKKGKIRDVMGRDRKVSEDKGQSLMSKLRSVPCLGLGGRKGYIRCWYTGKFGGLQVMVGLVKERCERLERWSKGCEDQRGGKKGVENQKSGQEGVRNWKGGGCWAFSTGEKNTRQRNEEGEGRGEVEED